MQRSRPARGAGAAAGGLRREMLRGERPARARTLRLGDPRSPLLLSSHSCSNAPAAQQVETARVLRPAKQLLGGEDWLLTAARGGFAELGSSSCRQQGRQRPFLPSWPGTGVTPRLVVNIMVSGEQDSEFQPHRKMKVSSSVFGKRSLLLNSSEEFARESAAAERAIHCDSVLKCNEIQENIGCHRS